MEKKYIIYTRKSTDDTVNQRNSLEYQLKACIQFAKHNHFNISEESLSDGNTPIVENGVIQESHTAYKTSSLTFSNGLVQYAVERPKFMKMLEWLTEGKFAGVIVLCWDRISRNDQDDLLLKRLIDENKITVKFVEANYDHEGGALHRDIDSMFSKHYSRTISNKIRLAYKKLRSEGKCTYRSPIGYIDNGKCEKVLDPETAPKVRQLFELYATGEWSLTELGKWCKKVGLQSKPTRSKGKKESPKIPREISRAGISKILKNPFYIGKISDKGEFIQGSHPPLISLQLFSQVQKALQGRTQTIHYLEKAFHTYRGLIKCTCGRTYSPYVQKGNTYYQLKCTCNNKKKNLSESLINEALTDIMGTISFTQRELEEIQKEEQIGIESITQTYEKVQKRLLLQKKKIQDDLEYLKENKITLLRTESMTPQEIHKENEKLDFELEKINSELNQNKQNSVESLQGILDFSELCKMASDLYQSAFDEEKKELVNLMFSELYIKDGKMASYKAKPAFEILLQRPRGKVEKTACTQQKTAFHGDSAVSFGGVQYLFSELQKNQSHIKQATIKLQAKIKKILLRKKMKKDRKKT